MGGGKSRRGGGGAIELWIDGVGGRSLEACGGGSVRPSVSSWSAGTSASTCVATTVYVRINPGHGENVVVDAPAPVSYTHLTLPTKA